MFQSISSQLPSSPQWPRQVPGTSAPPCRPRVAWRCTSRRGVPEEMPRNWRRSFPRGLKTRPLNGYEWILTNHEKPIRNSKSIEIIQNQQLLQFHHQFHHVSFILLGTMMISLPLPHGGSESWPGVLATPQLRRRRHGLQTLWRRRWSQRFL